MRTRLDLTPGVRVAAVVVVGAIGLSLSDQMHVHGGVLSYDDRTLWDQAWWVPLQFAAATVAILAGAMLFARELERPSGGRLAVAGAWFVAAYAASALAAPEHAYLLAAGLWALWLARVAAVPAGERRPLVAFSLLLAASGCAAEMIISAAGVFEYAGDDAAVLLWLSAIYANGAPLALGLAAWLRLRA